MSTVDSDSDVRLSSEFAARERQRWLTPSEPPASLPCERLLATDPPPASDTEPAPPPMAAADEPRFALRLFDRLATAPSWLVSLVLHLAALIALGLLTLPPNREQPPTALVVAVAEPAMLETIDEFVIAPPLEELTHEVIDAPEGVLSEFRSLTETVAMSDVAAAAATDPGAVEVGELQNLFASGGAGLKDLNGAAGSAEFFGVKAGGRRFVFVVDSSNSMRGAKFKEAREELLYAVRRLDKTQAFYVIFFDNNALRMFDSEKQDSDEEPELRPIAATLPNIRRLEKWLTTVENGRRTDPYEAMKIALEMLPDAIFLLSDGEFTDRGRTERYLAERNIIDDPAEGRRPLVVIHAIGFYSKDGEATLATLAKEYQGTYRFVAPPRRR